MGANPNVYLIILICLFCGSNTVLPNKPELVFFSVQKYKSTSLQSVRMAEKLQLEQWKCTSTGKFEETAARNCAPSSHCFEVSKLADPRNFSRISDCYSVAHCLYFFPEPYLASRHL